MLRFFFFFLRIITAVKQNNKADFFFLSVLYQILFTNFAFVVVALKSKEFLFGALLNSLASFLFIKIFFKTERIFYLQNEKKKNK